MLYLYIWLFPILAGALAWLLKSEKLNKLLILIHSVIHLGFGLALFFPGRRLSAALNIDNYSVWFFAVSALLYFAVAIYTLQQDQRLSPRQSSIYAVCLMAFVASMDGANLSRDLGLIWVFVETTTLASAMLISFEHHKQSLEAAWKYLFICSIGIALAFMGILLLIIAQPATPSLSLDRIIQRGYWINSFWLKLSFVFMLIGFGTKVGLAPMHFWLPDAHSEAPAGISALLSGALLNTALLPLLRMQKVLSAAQLGYLASQLFIALGLASLFVAAVFILKVKNYKRLLAYSSIENMGIILIAFALGDLAGKAGLIHTLGHSLIKAAFFLSAGNLYSLYKAKDYNRCSGLLSRDPNTGWLWLICFVFIIGMPPSPLFFSELYIALGLLASGNYFVLALWFILLASIVYGLGKASLEICMGYSEEKTRLPFSQYLPQAMLLLLAVAVPIAVLLLRP